MDGSEVVVFMLSAVLTLAALIRWYQPLLAAWPPGRGRTARTVLGLLPVASFFVFYHTLRHLASFDVVDSPLYITFYLLLGFAWLALGVYAVAAFFDLSRVDDLVHMDNPAALPAFAGAFLGLSVMYAASNIGDGPGWWCVVFAGGIALFLWIACGLALHAAAHVFERITVERDTACGIRVGGYLLACALILGRAAAGDWVSFGGTVADFAVAWPAAPLALFAILAERGYHRAARQGHAHEGSLGGSVFFACLWITFAVAYVRWLPPPAEHPAPYFSFS